MTLRKASLADGSTVEYVEVADPPSGRMKRTFFTPDRRQAVQFFHGDTTGKDPLRRQRLEAVVGRFNPTTSPTTGAYWRGHFCWPLGVVVRPSLGLLCPAFPGNFFFSRHPVPGESGRVEKKGRWFTRPALRRLLSPDDRGDLRRFLAIAIRLARAVRRLHTAGLAHADLSGNNVLIDLGGPTAPPALMIIDLDALVVPGLFPPDVLGTKGYIAPEVVATSNIPATDPTRALPDVRTDQHAVAVMIYEYLLRRHPLIGPRVHDREADRDEWLALGTKALYIEHPADRTNRPRDLSPPVESLGPELAALFHRAFVEGLHAPPRRPTALEWERALVRTFDLIRPCPNPSCDGRWLVAVAGQGGRCPWCRAIVGGPGLGVVLLSPGPRGPAPDGRVVIYDGKALHRWHVSTDHPAGETADPEPCAHFSRPGGRWVLVNRRLASLSVTGPIARPVPIGGSVELTPGLRLRLSEQPTGRWAEVTPM